MGLLKRTSNEQRNVIVANLHMKLDAIDRYDRISEDDAPFRPRSFKGSICNQISVSNARCSYRAREALSEVDAPNNPQWVF